MKSYSFAGDVVTAVVVAANQDFSVAHDLGRIPVDAFVVYRSKACRFWRGGPPWTATHIYLRASVANTFFTVLTFGQGVGDTMATTKKQWASFTYFSHGNPQGSGHFIDAATHNWSIATQVPYDYTSGDITWKVMRRAGAAANTAVMNYSLSVSRDATAYTTVVALTADNFTPGDTNSHLSTYTLTSGNFQAGDIIEFRWQRLGADAGDTLASFVKFEGGWIEYTA